MALGQQADAITKLAASNERLADAVMASLPDEDEDEGPTRYMDGTPIQG